MSARPTFGFDYAYLVLTVEDGRPLNLYTVDLTEGPAGQEGGDFAVKATFADNSTLTVVLTPDGISGLETFEFTNFLNVTSVSFGVNLPDGQHRIDNIVAEIIPEPTTILLFSLGCLVLRRKHKK